MPELEDAREQAQRAAQEAAEAKRETTARVEAVGRLTAARAAEARRLDPRAPATARRLEQLDAEIATAEQAAAEARATYARSHAAALDAGRRFRDLTDPRKDADRLSDEIPVLLMPLRLETRFLDGSLCVRAYPDEWAVDAFSERLSEIEVEGAGRYWTGVWRAGGDEGRRRAAWRGLVGSHGSGRAAWIVEQLEPLNPADEPRRGDPDEVILVVASEQPLPSSLRRHALAHWPAVWRAGDDRTALEAARTQLLGAVGAADAERIEAQPPANLDEEPPRGRTRAATPVSAAFLDLPTAASLQPAPTSWSEAARARVLPDRLVLHCWIGDRLVVDELGEPIPPTLAVGPDPDADPADQLRIERGRLHVPDELRWMVDFERAIADGMGFRVPLDPETAGGFDRLVVMGLRVGADPATSQTELESLLRRHQLGRTGVRLVPQGTPTNNSEQQGAGFDRGDDADASFDLRAGTGQRLEARADWNLRQDGEWLATCLGIELETLAHVGGATGTDQSEARAMNAALWPGTWGYFLDAMLAPAVGDADVEAARSFFTTYVSGRGLVPPIQIGKQPYGILPTTAFSRLEWEERPAHGTRERRPDARRAFVARLDRLLRQIAADWAPLADKVPRVGAGGDPHQLLLDLVGLHPTSAEFHQRYLESLDDLHNRLSLAGVFDLLRLLASLGRVSAARALLERLGYEGRDPDILTKLLLRRQHALRGPLVDDRPLSEDAPVRAYTTDGHNYLTWLARAGSTSLDALRREEGFADDAAPTVLLYLMLRHALLVAWRRTGLRLQWSAGSIEGAALTQALREPSFVHVAADAAGSESHWQSLYATDAQVTQDPQLPIAGFIPTVLGVRPDAAVLHEALQAIERLQEVPAARLERLLAEHVDTCSYRLDAWRLGIVHQRLLAMRHGPGGDQPARPGIHLGVYGFLQEVRPKDRRLHPQQLEGPLAETFNDPADPPLQHDELNGGHVLAPSLNHAAAAAILRSGYRARLADGNPGALAVKLTSERVRLATAVIDGLRNGQSLSALLGYRLERGLHDRHGEVEVDRFVFALRKAFPHRADRQAQTRTGPGVPIEAVEARDVIDGLALVTHVSRTDDRTYPFGLPQLPPADAAQRRAIDAEVERLLDVHDALGDLALAEGVYQAVLGNHERVASTLDAYAKAGFPPEPGVAETPRSGATLTQRVALHLRPGLSPSRSPLAGVPMTPQASAEPAVNEFLAEVLPLPADVACSVTWTDPITRRASAREVTQHDLGLQPVDLLRLVRLDDAAALGELDERVLRHVAGLERLRADVEPAIDYTTPIAGKLTFFELGPLIAHLRSALGRSRPLRPSDAVPHSEASRALDAAIETDAARPAALRTALQGIAPPLQALETDLRAPLETSDHAALAAGVDGFLQRLVERFAEAGLFGVGGTGWGGLLQRRAQLFADVLTAVATVVRRFEVALREADELLRRDDLLPTTATDAERIELLMLAERLLSTTLTTPTPATADLYRAAVDARRTAFVAKLDALRAVASVTGGLSDVLGAVDALLPLTDFDRDGVDLRAVQVGVFELCADVRARAAALRAEIEHRVAAAGERLAAHAAATAADARVDAIVEATRLLCGEDVVVVPQFTLGAEQADEWDAAMAWSRSGGLTAHLSATRSHPVEDWLHGVARVREKLRHWEQAVLLGGVIGRAEPELRPLQLPHASEPWLALELPPGHTLTAERLLYTAHYSSPFVKTAPQCGLLLDEWTEVVPGERETTGVAFNYDRPDSEPPQTMLLVTPPRFRGGWRWDDLVAAVHETVDLARLRCVEPTGVDATPYAQLLPATVMAATVREVSISTNLARNNKLLELLLARGDDA